MSKLAIAVAVVGLAAAVGGAARGTGNPSKSGCAVAWNRTAPPALRSSIAGDHPRGAFVNSAVSVGRVTWTDATKGGQSTSTSGPGCGIQFILASGRTLSVWGRWRDGGVPKWSGPVPSARPIPVPNNSNVHPDGTVGFHG